MAVDLEDRDDESMCDVSLEQPSFLILAGIVAVLVAKPKVAISRCSSHKSKGRFLLYGLLVHEQVPDDLKSLA